MPSKAELMALGVVAPLAGKLGTDPLTSFTAAGTTQGTATSLTACFANVTTPSASANGIILVDAFGISCIFNAGPAVLVIYPPVGGTFVGLAINVGVDVSSGSGALVYGDGLNFFAVVSGP